MGLVIGPGLSPEPLTPSQIHFCLGLLGIRGTVSSRRQVWPKLCKWWEAESVPAKTALVGR